MVRAKKTQQLKQSELYLITDTPRNRAVMDGMINRFYYDKPDALDYVVVRVRWEKVFPNRFDWLCPACESWNRYYETKCPTCTERIMR